MNFKHAKDSIAALLINFRLLRRGELGSGDDARGAWHVVHSHS
jgi:hypothetical protein